MKKPAWMFLGLLALLPTLLSAQNVANVGARVRVAARGEGANGGLLLAVSRDSLLIGFPHRRVTPVTLGRDRIERLQKSLGGDVWRGAAVGAQVGLAAGAVGFGLEHLMSRSSSPRFHYDNGDLAFAAATGAVWGLLAGTFTGAVVARERWEDAELPASSEPLPSFSERAVLQTRARLGIFAEGSALRVRTQDGRWVQGRYDGLTNDFLRIVDDSSHLVAIAQIIEISERRPMTGPWLRRGMWLGAALGAAFVAGVALNEEDCDPDSCLSAWGFIPAFAIGGAFTGAAAGGILGSHVKGWRTQNW